MKRSAHKLINAITWLLTLVLVAGIGLADAADDAVAPLDYSDAQYWAYFGDEDGDAAIDVFFICPSVFGGKEGSYTMDLTNEKAAANFVGAINMEKGIYDKNARFYAPFYRQVGYNVYALPDEDAEPLKQSAFEDVADAFDYYMANQNDGRPFIIAGFSQGADMAIRLLKAKFDDAALRDQLIACYAIGWRLTQDDIDEYPQLRAAQGETDTGVIISFNSEAEDVTDSALIPAGVKTLSINPLNWRTDDAPADKSQNLGACFTDNTGAVTEEIPALTGAYLDDVRGALKVTDIDADVYNATISILTPGVYHLYDYQFFYRNLQQNVQARTQAYFEAEAQEAA